MLNFILEIKWPYIGEKCDKVDEFVDDVIYRKCCLL
jgi:hypothetical protein